MGFESLLARQIETERKGSNAMHTTISNNKGNTRRNRLNPEQQSNQLVFEKKTIKDQASKIAEQTKAVAEFLKKQSDKGSEE